MRTFHLKIIPVECVVKFGPTFWMAGCKKNIYICCFISQELCFDFVLFRNYHLAFQICLLEETRDR